MNSFEEIFNLMKANLDITEFAKKTWIDPIKPIELENKIAILSVDVPFIKRILEENYVNIFKTQLKEILGFDIEINIICGDNNNQVSNITADTINTTKVDIPVNESVINNTPSLNERIAFKNENGNYRHTFDTFIEGESNKLAYASCKAVAKGQKGYNPLYIYGNPGLGKTHLLSAVKNFVLENRPELKIVFVSSDTFFNDYINSLNTKSTVEFKNKYRTADMLLLDDVHFFAGKKECQNELFNTFNELHSNDKQIIFTSDRPPKEINNLDQRLLSRFEWGLLADISIPKFETRLAIIQRKANLLGLEVNHTVLEFIANKLKNNIRQLEGAIIKLNALSMVADITPTLAMARDVINEILDESVPTSVTVERVINEVAGMYGLKGEDLRSKQRNANISNARQIAIYTIHKITGIPYVEIGKEFGNRDHSTIVYAVKKVEELMKKDKSFRETVENLIKNLNNN